MKIQKIYNAAIGATYDRAQITRDSKKVEKLNNIELNCYKKMKSVSGPSVHNPIKIAHNWRLAFLDNLKRQNIIAELNAPFQNKSPIVTTTKQVIKNIIKTIKKA